MISQDYLIITNMLNRVMLAMDTAEKEVFSSCFSTEATCEIKITNQSFTGKEELEGLCASLAEKFKDARHWEGNICLHQNTEGQMINTSYWKAIDGGTIISTGIHRDLLIRDPNQEGNWLIKKRTIDHTYTKAGGNREAELYSVVLP